MYYVYCRKEETQNKQPTSISHPPQALTSGANFFFTFVLKTAVLLLTTGGKFPKQISPIRLHVKMTKFKALNSLFYILVRKVFSSLWIVSPFITIRESTFAFCFFYCI